MKAYQLAKFLLEYPDADVHLHHKNGRIINNVIWQNLFGGDAEPVCIIQTSESDEEDMMVILDEVYDKYYHKDGDNEDYFKALVEDRIPYRMAKHYLGDVIPRDRDDYLLYLIDADQYDLIMHNYNYIGEWYSLDNNAIEILIDLLHLYLPKNEQEDFIYLLHKLNLDIEDLEWMANDPTLQTNGLTHDIVKAYRDKYFNNT